MGTLLLGICAVALLVITTGLAGVSLLYTRDLVPGGFETLGIALGQGTQAEAANALGQAWATRMVTVDLGQGRTQMVRPEELGVMLDITGTVRLAYTQGRTSAAILQMLRDRRLAVPSTNLPPVWHYDPARADRTLQAVARQVDVAPRNGTVRVNGTRVETTPPAAGRVLDVAASGAVLGSDPWSPVLRGRFEPFFATVTPTITDTSKIVAQVQPWVASPVAIHLYDAIADEKRDWQLAPELIAGWISIAPRNDDPARLEATLDAGRVSAYLADQAKALGDQRLLDLEKAVPAVSASVTGKHEEVRLRINHADRQYQVQAGDTVSSVADRVGIPYPWIQKANPGLGDAIRPGQTIKIPSVDALIPLQPVEDKRIVVSIKEQKMWAYENGKLKWQWPVSTGLSFSPTAPGFFQIQTHEKNAYAGKWDLWMPYFMGVYRPVPDIDFMNGFHGFPSRGGAQLLWTNDLGHPVTYGCILLSSENDLTLYNWATEGVVVEIRA